MGLNGIYDGYPAWENPPILTGKTHYFDWAIFNSYFAITRGYPEKWWFDPQNDDFIHTNLCKKTSKKGDFLATQMVALLGLTIKTIKTKQQLGFHHLWHVWYGGFAMNNRDKNMDMGWIMGYGIHQLYGTRFGCERETWVYTVTLKRWF